MATESPPASCRSATPRWSFVAEREDTASTTAGSVAVPPMLGAEVAKAVAVELVPMLEAMLKVNFEAFLTTLQEQRAELEAALRRGLEPPQDVGSQRASTAEAATAPGATVAGELDAAAAAELEAVSAKLEAMAPQLEQVYRKTVRLESELHLNRASERGRMSEAAMVSQKIEESVEKAMRTSLRTIENTLTMHEVTPRQNLSRLAREMEAKQMKILSKLRTTHSAQRQSRGRQALALAAQTEDLSENEGDEVYVDRTVVINTHRFHRVMQHGNMYMLLIRWSSVAGLAIVAASDTVRFADIIFFASSLLLYVSNAMSHGMIMAAHKAFRLGEHAGNDGQGLLDEASPGSVNPNSCIQALTLRWWAYFDKKAIEVVLWVVLLAAWACILSTWWPAIGFSYLPAEQVAHATVLAGLGTAYLISSVLFTLILKREMHFVLPSGIGGRSWDMSEDGVPGPLGFLLGAPSVCFGSRAAYDDLRVWATLASRRPRRWAVSQAAAQVAPEEMAVYALQGRDHAARLAASLYGAKLFDGHRQKFCKRLLPEERRDDDRPAVVLSGLSAEGEGRGHLFDVDLRREYPEALRLHLLFYDSQTGITWMPKQTGQDPLNWAMLKKWHEHVAEAPGVDKTHSKGVQEEPDWDPWSRLGCSASADIHVGTFRGQMTVVSVARGEAAADIQAEVAALKKLGAHRHILALFTSGVTPEGSPYVALESYAAVGCLLSEHVNRLAWEGRSLPPTLAKQLFQGLADALAHMHEHSLLHRSLRAQGVIVMVGEQQAKLADLGVVDMAGARDRLKGSHVAPEVCRGNEQGPPVDCWGLGVVLHQVYQGRSDLVEFHVNPPRPVLGTPSRLRDMDPFVQEAMHGLLDFYPRRRWTLRTLKESSWFTRIRACKDNEPVEGAELEPRLHLCRWFGRGTPPPTCALRVGVADHFLVGKTLAELAFEETGVRALLVVRSSGTVSLPLQSLRLDIGDSLCFGLPLEKDADSLLGALAQKLLRLEHAIPDDLPVPGFQRASAMQRVPVSSPGTLPTSAEASPAVLAACMRLPLFLGEFDCFCLPDHVSRVEHMDLEVLHSLGLRVAGLVSSKKWEPDWFPPVDTAVQPGDLCLVMRAPQQGSASAPSLEDRDLRILMSEADFMAQVAVYRGLEEASSSL